MGAGMGEERELFPDGKQHDLLLSCNLFIHLFSHFSPKL